MSAPTIDSSWWDHLVPKSMSGLRGEVQSHLRRGVVAEFRAGSEFPLSRTGLSYALNLGSAEGIEAVHQCDADVDFGGLTIGIA